MENCKELQNDLQETTYNTASSNFEKTAGEFGVYYDATNQCFPTNQMVVYNTFKYAGYGIEAIAGIMGNIEAESGFSTAWSGHDGSVGICQWAYEARKNNLESYAQAVGKDKTSIEVQANFILQEAIDSNSNPYRNSNAVNCLRYLKYASPVPSVNTAADYFTALYEGCHSIGSLEETESNYEGRYSSIPNAYDGRYYLDTPKRRGYANSYYVCLLQMQ